MPSQFGFHSHPWKSRVTEPRPSSSGFTTMHLGAEFCPNTERGADISAEPGGSHQARFPPTLFLNKTR